MLVNDVSLRNLIPSELAKGFGFFKVSLLAFSPVAVTPDEITAWDNQAAKLYLPIQVHLNGELLAAPMLVRI